MSEFGAKTSGGAVVDPPVKRGPGRPPKARSVVTQRTVTPRAPQRPPSASTPPKRAKIEYVYFAAADIGNWVVRSDDYDYIALGNGTADRRKSAGCIVEFLATGVSRAYNPLNVDDAALIAEANAALDAHRDGSTIDDRIDRFKIRRVHPEAPAPPDSRWDVTDERKLPAVAQIMGWNIAQCIAYEDSKVKPRLDLIRALERMLEDQSEDVFSSVEGV